MKWILALLLILAACTTTVEQQAMTKPAVQPELVVQQAPPALESEAKAPQEQPGTSTRRQPRKKYASP